MDVVTQIKSLVGWTEQSASVDWDEIVAVTGVPFPQDFRDLVEAFPPGEFQGFFSILHPANYADAEEYRRALTEHAKLLRKKNLDGAPDVYPRPGGLIPWATVQFDSMLCWVPEDGDAEKWTVAVVSTSPGEREIRYPMTATELVRGLLTVPTPVTRLSYVAEAEQPPFFGRLIEDDDSEWVEPSGDMWLQPEVLGPLATPVDAVDQLCSRLSGASAAGGTRHGIAGSVASDLPNDYRRLVGELGPISVGPARLLASPERETEMDRLRERIAAERAAGSGPAGTFHPEDGGVILWGRLDGGGYLFWIPVSTDPDSWPVVLVDESLRFSAFYRMSASRFLLELATDPAAVLLPPPA